MRAKAGRYKHKKRKDSQVEVSREHSQEDEHERKGLKRNNRRHDKRTLIRLGLSNLRRYHISTERKIS